MMIVPGPRVFSIVGSCVVDVVLVTGTGPVRVVVSAQTFVSDAVLAQLPAVRRARRLAPVLPVRSRKGLAVPFLHAGEMVAHGDPAAQKLSEFALDYECARGGIGRDAVFEQMRKILAIVRGGVRRGWRVACGK